ncbi:hypothetical protein LCGC14_1165570 [marine sediment metagenome]|uniref:Baseplate protein J-like domain-containing protein n=1 Tax=marine sediment metagenome TaxID=412755 RepID=A0A0F9LRF9_9ZZZZ
MAINTPENATEISQRTKVDVQRELGSSNPFLSMAWLGGMISGLSNRTFEFYKALSQTALQQLPDTATGEFLARWAAIWGIVRLAATQATGRIHAFTGLGILIPPGTVFKVGDKSYTVDSLTTAGVPVDNSIVSITRSGSVAEVTTTANHFFASNAQITINGANEAEYNLVNPDIIVTGNRTFTYEVAGTPATPATGTLTYGAFFALVSVTSVKYGDPQNQLTDVVMTLETPITGVTDEASVLFQLPVEGGAKQEIDTEFRVRFLERLQNPVAHFNVSDIIAQMKLVTGITRVFVKEITPAVGQVTVYFTRDKDSSPIPSAPEITTAKNKLLEIKPATTSDADVIVSAPSELSQDFTFTDLQPATDSMFAAVSARLQQFFEEVPEVGVDVDEDVYRSAIANTVDTSNGDTVETFTLSTPTGDITTTSAQLVTLGTVTPP